MQVVVTEALSGCDRVRTLLDVSEGVTETVGDKLELS